MLAAASSRASVDLVLAPGKPPAVNGADGISQKGARPGNASHYYSLTRMPTRGTIVVDGERFEVSGESWMDHEFGTSFLEPEQQGWDWLSIQLDTGGELMLYQLRRSDGTRDPRSSGTLVDAQGRTTHLAAADFTMTRSARTFRAPSGAVYPVAWTVAIPGRADRARGHDAARQSGTGHARRRRHLLGRHDRRSRHHPRRGHHRARLSRNDRLQGQLGPGDELSGWPLTTGQDFLRALTTRPPSPPVT